MPDAGAATYIVQDPCQQWIPLYESMTYGLAHGPLALYIQNEGPIADQIVKFIDSESTENTGLHHKSMTYVVKNIDTIRCP